MRPYTVVYLMHFPADESSEGFGRDYRREGEFEAVEQLTSFVRDSALAFWREMKEEEKP